MPDSTAAGQAYQRPTVPNDMVSDNVVPHGTLPPLRYRDLPAPVPLRKMIGPGIILAGLALGSGEFVLWPYITYKSQFVFFWACLLGVTTQYFLNMEITRWTLATGESAITGFIRLSKHWAWVFLLMNTVPYVIPAWAKGAADILSWLIWEPSFNDQGELVARHSTALAIGSMILCGVILTAGPVLYNTVERVQMVLVGLIIALVIVLSVWLLKDRPDAIVAQARAAVTFGAPHHVPEFDEQLTVAALLGALAFAGAGGTLNLGQSNYIKDKGYGMGAYIGRITSPITGKDEPITETGYFFQASDENRRRWRIWWRRASLEHFFSFYLTCLVSLVLLTLIAYVLFYDAEGNLVPGAGRYQENLAFIWAEAGTLAAMIGPAARVIFLIMGVAILLTTEFGILDAASRVSTDLVKVAWLRDRAWWSESRIYYVFLWGTIAVASGILLLKNAQVDVSAFTLFKLTAAMNGAVMFLYSMTLLYLNRRGLPPGVRMPRWRVVVMIWSVLFFGYFSAWVGYVGIKAIAEDMGRVFGG